MRAKLPERFGSGSSTSLPQQALMNTRSTRFTGRHEIPTFVLERTEIANGTDASTRLAAGATATAVANQEIVR